VRRIEGEEKIGALHPVGLVDAGQRLVGKDRRHVFVHGVVDASHHAAVVREPDD
jgi:hypothetical protein